MNDIILRMKPHEIIIHWLHLICFCVLLVTGVLLFLPRFPFLGEMLKGSTLTKSIHHIFAIPFIIFLPFLIWMFWKPCKWEKGDFTWITKAGGYLGNLFKGAPEAGEFNAGQKLFYYNTIVSGILFAISGVIMWQASRLPPELVRWMYIVHDLAMVMVVLMFVAHVYLSTIGAPGSIQLLFTGKVSKSWARLHHPRWYKELERKR
jgi:formate dehydrogenase subunit gamma